MRLLSDLHYLGMMVIVFQLGCHENFNKFPIHSVKKEW